GALCAGSLERTVREAAAGGAQVVQLREKGLADGALLERARQVRRWTRAAGVLFIMNDRPDLARLAEADGVHLGQDELPVKAARGRERGDLPGRRAGRDRRGAAPPPRRALTPNGMRGRSCRL